MTCDIRAREEMEQAEGRAAGGCLGKFSNISPHLDRGRIASSLGERQAGGLLYILGWSLRGRTP